MKPARPESQTAIEVARITARQVILVTIITATAGTLGAVIQGFVNFRKNNSIHAQLDTTAKRAGVLEKELKESGPEREALYRLTANYLENDLALSSGKEGSAQSSG